MCEVINNLSYFYNNKDTEASDIAPFANATGTLDDNDLFSLDMRYENPTAAYTPTGTTATPQYGGNISQMVWQVRGKQKQVYTFQYDHLSRMTEANYSELNASNVKIDDANKYMEKLTYDARGNIKTLQRNGLTGSCTFGQIDNLSYFYNNNDTEASDFAPKNRLRKVTESSLTTKGFKRQGTGGDYTYDANGNLKSDPNKGITLIEYNHLNLPMKVTFNTGSTIEWLYDAGGRKLRKTATAAPATITVNGQPIAPGTYISTGLLTSTGLVSANTSVTLKGKLGVELLPNFETQPNSTFEAAQDAAITGDIQDYVDGIEYKNGAFEAIYHAEGRVTMINGALKYEYALKDHLGNTRLMFSDKDNNGVISQNANQELSEVTQEAHFYAFGMAMEGTWSNTPSVSDLKYLYNGKEMNSDFGLDWMDYGARFYDAAIGRWPNVDPLAEIYVAWSPYHYVMGNPVNFIDPNGMGHSEVKDEGKPTRDIWGNTTFYGSFQTNFGTNGPPSGNSTIVTQNQNGTYTVVGGNKDDNDNGIYLSNNGQKGTLIGYSATPESFYFSEHAEWMGTINPNDLSGRNFLNTDILNNNLNIVSYMANATGGKKYDFKRTNGSDQIIFNLPREFYRGMPILGTENGKPIYASARDVGNIAAGLVAGRSGEGWSTARLGYDALESFQQGTLATESTSTKYGQKLGHRIGFQMYQKFTLSRLPSYAQLRNITISNAPIKKGE